MFARSVVLGLREIESRLAAIQDKPILRGQLITTKQSDEVRTILRELVELLRGSELGQASDPEDRHDDRVIQLLAAMYTEGTTYLEPVKSYLANGTGTIQLLCKTGQIKIEHSEVYVPLHRGEMAKNWPPVLSFLVQQLGEFVQTAEEIIQKLHADGADNDSLGLLLVQSVLTRLKHLRTVLRSQLGQLQIINYSVFIDTQLNQFVADFMPNAFGVNTK